MIMLPTLVLLMLASGILYRNTPEVMFNNTVFVAVMLLVIKYLVVVKPELVS
jgi:hypothetical protein